MIADENHSEGPARGCSDPEDFRSSRFWYWSYRQTFLPLFAVMHYSRLANRPGSGMVGFGAILRTSAELLQYVHSGRSTPDCLPAPKLTSLKYGHFTASRPGLATPYS